MYLIGNKGVGAAINRETSMGTILAQLPGLTDRQLELTADYIRGLQAADIFLSR